MVESLTNLSQCPTCGEPDRLVNLVTAAELVPSTLDNLYALLTRNKAILSPALYRRWKGRYHRFVTLRDINTLRGLLFTHERRRAKKDQIT